ncbi:hypothetical protein KR074_012635, partial [Drosophila pseudoananassae]
DNIVLLTNRTIWKALKAPALGKLVQFMRPTCGACVSFAPKFEAVAHELKRWNSVLRIYYVNCDKEWDLCSSFKLKATPTLRFFPSRFVFGKQGYGRDITKREPREIISALATHLSRTDFRTREPNFLPLESTDNLSTIFRPYDQALQNVLIVLQEKNSTLGFHTLLNLMPYTDLAVRIVEDPRIFLKFGLPPTLKGVILGRNGSTKYRVLMMSWLCTIILDPTNGLIEVTKKRKGVVVYQYPERANTQKKSILLDENEEIIKKVLDRPMQIYQADVEMAIHILMHSEIPKIKIIKGKAFESLMNFLAVLVHFSPMKLERMHWFDKLKNVLINAKGVMFGIEFQDLVYSHELAVGKLIGAVDFVGCRSSAAYPRGFSCALWHLFHYLTVQASLFKPQTYKPGYVLNIIASFIRYFFPSCPECSRTFQEIAQARKVHEVRDYDEEILWMWEAHNEINRHLAGGLLEDPLFPKKQFPTAKSCPDCKTNDVWDRKKVLNHLKDIYAMEKLS